ncbi:MAG TPA: NADH-quinone oxidoreductase subunit F [Candidatus Riflebacteria bacterium]|jgi:NADH-quinone oxidoreductase subunit F|nr:NADH-quinone oxidoreductase subunit F [Candidatus Riflebacteria bacterium]
MNTTALDLKKIAADFRNRLEERRVIVCAGTACVANGALALIEALVKSITSAGINARVDVHEEDKRDLLLSKSGCHGFCQMGPLVTIMPENILYTRVKAADAAEIVEKTLVKGEIIERLLFVDQVTAKPVKGSDEITFYNRQKRTVLKDCGHIDPEDINEYIAHDGYEGARIACNDMKPVTVCEEVMASWLRGRGGGGFPTGRKWQLTLDQPGAKKYVICNADEGDPGAFMDRSVMEGNPHAVIEGMMIAARAIGADEGVVYCRAEYPMAVKRMRKAIADARKLGILGKNIFDSGFNFDVNVMEGAGAFVCGEETALIASVEGKRGMPTPKPPFPAESGLFGKPTVINNVETLATVPLIIRNGAQWFRSQGTAKSPGTKTFALTGHVANTGLIEVPFGTSLREIIFNIGGGITDDRGNPMPDGFKAVQIGGPSGGCLIHEHLDLPLDFDSLLDKGAMVGSGGLVVMNNSTCMVAIARFFMQFTQNESCGKCVLCREGTRQMLSMLDDIMAGNADEKTLENLEKLARAVAKGSLCGLGKTAPSPVISTLRYFRAEYEAHIFQKKCPAGQCKALANPEIDPALCKGCTVCVKKCPVGAISGELKKAHKIDVEKCIKCGACAAACKFNAIVGV